MTSMKEGYMKYWELTQREITVWEVRENFLERLDT